MRRHIIATVGAVLVLLGGCSDSREDAEQNEGSSVEHPYQAFPPAQAGRDETLGVAFDPGANQPQRISRAVAVLAPTRGNQAHGTVTFEETGDGLRVHANVDGLPEGAHGFHIHLEGDCSAPDGTSAGTHFNFRGSSESPPDDIDRITGNLGDLEAGEDGHASATRTIPDATLLGRFSILGRSVIVHEKQNDPTSPPIGAAGARLACGVIGVAAPPEDGE